MTKLKITPTFLPLKFGVIVVKNNTKYIIILIIIIIIALVQRQ